MNNSMSGLRLATRTEAQVRFERACKAADNVLGQIYMEIGRIVEEAPERDMVPIMASHGVKITGQQLTNLYNATQRHESETGELRI